MAKGRRIPSPPGRDRSRSRERARAEELRRALEREQAEQQHQCGRRGRQTGGRRAAEGDGPAAAFPRGGRLEGRLGAPHGPSAAAAAVGGRRWAGRRRVTSRLIAAVEDSPVDGSLEEGTFSINFGGQEVVIIGSTMLDGLYYFPDLHPMTGGQVASVFAVLEAV